MEFPKTLEEWGIYIASIDLDDLVRKAYSVNSLAFVKGLLSEGYEPPDVEGILTLFAKRLLEEGLFVPDGGDGFYVSYSDLLDGEDREA
jgi:hypothetical protein